MLLAVTIYAYLSVHVLHTNAICLHVNICEPDSALLEMHTGMILSWLVGWVFFPFVLDSTDSNLGQFH